ncbi:MAG: Ig-like domain-containing protein [Candidatus Riflebacteria bacterium]|nr:Ig-like domain-containing protein [Candidatus Riflebacteria bacterium]
MNRRLFRSFLFSLGLLACLTTPLHAAMGMSSTRGPGGGVQVVQTFPPDMANAVSPTTPLTVEFGGNVDQSFYQTINLNLFQGNKLVDGEMFYNPAARQIMFKAKKPLQGGETYTAHLTWAAGAGNGEKVWNFQVGGAAPATPKTPGDGGAAPAAGSLRIVQASMAAGTIDSDKPLEITFSEPIDLGSLREAPVRMMSGKTPMGIDYRLSRDRKTLTLIPRTALQPGQDYGITLTPALAGGSGSRLAKNVVIPFQFASGEVAPNVIEEAPPEETLSTAAGNGLENPFGGNDAVAAPRPTRAAAPVRPATPLKLVGLSPQNNATVANLSVPVTVAFSSEIRPETLNEFTFRLEDDFGPVPAKIRYFPGRKQGTLTPIGVLDAMKTYRVVVTQGITDAAGRNLQKGITTTFATSSPTASPEVPDVYASDPAPARTPARAPARRPTALPAPTREPDQESAELESFDDGPGMAMVEPRTPPAPVPTRTATRTAPTRPANRSANRRQALSSFKVSQILPGANAQAVARDSRIYVYFSEPAQTTTVNPINISVFGEQRRVEGKVVYDAGRNCAVFHPAEPLKAETEYKVLVNDKIRSANGEALSSRVSWAFQTTGETRRTWQARPAYEADASFDIPLVDGRGGARAPASRPTQASLAAPAASGPIFSTVPANHWTFKSLRHIAGKGLLSSFPFSSTSGVTRYQFANALSTALGTLRAMGNNPGKTRLKVADMVELYQLVVAFRSELRSFGVDTAWFEAFMARQGVRAPDVAARVAALNRRSS